MRQDPFPKKCSWHVKREEALSETQDLLEGFHILSGLAVPQGYLGRSCNALLERRWSEPPCLAYWCHDLVLYKWIFTTLQ